MRTRRPRNHNAREDAFFRHNRQIRISPIRLIDEHGEMQGVVPTEQALRRAQDAGLDLVEIAPNVRPPVCRILDYGKWKYEQQKKTDKQRATQRHTGLKEVKIRTTKIDPHDLSIKTGMAKRFLESGYKVQVTLQYRGREMAHQEIGRDIMDAIKRDLFMISKVEQDFRLQGRRGNMVLAPDVKDVKKVRAPDAGESITVGTKGVALADGPAPKVTRLTPAGVPVPADGVKPPKKKLFPDRAPGQPAEESHDTLEASEAPEAPEAPEASEASRERERGVPAPDAKEPTPQDAPSSVPPSRPRATLGIPRGGVGVDNVVPAKKPETAGTT